MPPYEIERKYLIRKPDLLSLSNLCNRVISISQTYLVATEGSVRVRRSEEKGQVSFTETAKRSVTSMRRMEIERELTEEEYNRRLKARDPRRQTLHKHRYCLPYNGHVFEIDIFSFWSGQALMEIELSSENEEFTLPPFIRVIKEVTEDLRYSNYNLAREIPPEEKE